MIGRSLFVIFLLGEGIANYTFRGKQGILNYGLKYYLGFLIDVAVVSFCILTW